MSKSATPVTPDSLHTWAMLYTRTAKQEGRERTLPTFQEAASHFSVELEDIEHLIYDYDGEGYLGEITGFRSVSFRHSATRIKDIADYQIEADLI